MLSSILVLKSASEDVFGGWWISISKMKNMPRFRLTPSFWFMFPLQAVFSGYDINSLIVKYIMLFAIIE